MTLTQAMDYSQRHNCICTVEFPGSHADLLVAADGAYDHEIDSVDRNDGIIEVWGYRTEAGDGEMDWRLDVILAQ